MSKIEIVANEKCYREYMAEKQLNDVGNLKGVTRAVGLPDLHAGKILIGIPIIT